MFIRSLEYLQYVFINLFILFKHGDADSRTAAALAPRPSGYAHVRISATSFTKDTFVKLLISHL